MDESRSLTVTSPERVPLNSSTSSSSGSRRPVVNRAPNQPSYGQNQQSQNDSVSGSCCGGAPSRKACALVSILLVLFILLTVLLAVLLIFGFNPKTLCKSFILSLIIGLFIAHIWDFSFLESLLLCRMYRSSWSSYWCHGFVG